MRRLADLLRYARNPRIHSAEQIEQLAASIREFGFINPIVVDAAGEIIAGHGRAMAAEKMGLKMVPTIEAAHLTPSQIRAYRIADNQLGLSSSWDEPLLKIELQELKIQNFELKLLGFPELQLVEFIAGVGGGADGAGPADAQAMADLADRFGVPPFSVLNARQGWWQDRKRAWLALGILSELGRGENLIGRSPQELFCHYTGIPYDKARRIVTDAMAEQGDAFDLQKLIAKHGGGKRLHAVPGNNAGSEKAKMPLDRGGASFAKTGAVMPQVKGGDVKRDLLEARGYPSKRGKPDLPRKGGSPPDPRRKDLGGAV